MAERRLNNPFLDQQTGSSDQNAQGSQGTEDSSLNNPLLDPQEGQAQDPADRMKVPDLQRTEGQGEEASLWDTYVEDPLRATAGGALEGAAGAFETLDMTTGVGGGTEEFLSDTAEGIFEGLSEEGQEAIKNRLFQETEDGEIVASDNARSWTLNMARTIGNLGTSIVGGKGLSTLTKPAAKGMAKQFAKRATKRATRAAERTGSSYDDALKGVLETAERRGEAIGGMAGFGASESAIASGMSSKEAKQRARQTPVEQLAKSQQFQKAYHNQPDYLSEEKKIDNAREQVANEAGQRALTRTAPATFLFGAGAGRFYDKLFRTGASTSRGLNALTGGTVETLQEAPQSAAEQYSVGKALQNTVDPSIDPAEGLIPDMLEGAALGFGAGAAASGAAPPARTEAPSQLRDQAQRIREAEQEAGDVERDQPLEMGDFLKDTTRIQSIQDRMATDEAAQQERPLSQVLGGVEGDIQPDGAGEGGATTIPAGPNLGAPSQAVDMAIPEPIQAGGVESTPQGELESQGQDQDQEPQTPLESYQENRQEDLSEFTKSKLAKNYDREGLRQLAERYGLETHKTDNKGERRVRSKEELAKDLANLPGAGQQPTDEQGFTEAQRQRLGPAQQSVREYLRDRLADGKSEEELTPDEQASIDEMEDMYARTGGNIRGEGNAEHRKRVRQTLRAGQTVPAKAVEYYPDLAEGYPDQIEGTPEFKEPSEAAERVEAEQEGQTEPASAAVSDVVKEANSRGMVSDLLGRVAPNADLDAVDSNMARRGMLIGALRNELTQDDVDSLYEELTQGGPETEVSTDASSYVQGLIRSQQETSDRTQDDTQGQQEEGPYTREYLESLKASGVKQIAERIGAPAQENGKPIPKRRLIQNIMDQQEKGTRAPAPEVEETTPAQEEPAPETEPEAETTPEPETQAETDEGGGEPGAAPGTGTETETQAETETATAERPQSESEWGANNTIVTQDRADELRQKLKQKLNQTNAGIDPELISMGAELAVFHIEAGAKEFGKWANRMIEDLGENARPYLKPWYNAARDWPELDTEGMTPYQEIEDKGVDALIEQARKEEDGDRTEDVDSDRTQDEPEGEGDTGIQNEPQDTEPSEPVGTDGTDGGQDSGRTGENEPGANVRGGGESVPGQGSNTGTASQSGGGGQQSGAVGSTDGEAGQGGLGAESAQGAETGRGEAGDGESGQQSEGVSGGTSQRRVAKEPENEFQVPYESESNGPNADVLTPANMKSPIERALSNLQEKVGDLDEYVKNKLNFDSTETMHNGLMGLQVDGVATAINDIENGGGVIIADATGVGKGRQAAAVIRYAIEQGKTPVFFTEKPQLFSDMWGDIEDVGNPGVKPFIVNHSTEIRDGQENLIHKSASDSKQKRILKEIANQGSLNAHKDTKDANAVFLTYSQIQSPNVQQQAIQALADDAVFILDESHNASGSSNRGQFMQNLLQQTNNGVMYMSATFAKRPDNMPVYFKTDLGKAVAGVDGLVDAMQRGGVPLQTMVSSMLSETGQLLRRERSFDGVELATRVATENSQRDRADSDQLTEGLREIVHADETFASEDLTTIRQMYDQEAQQTGSSVDVNHSPFTQVANSLVEQMLLSMKAKQAGQDAVAAIERGEKPVIALENTMGSFLKHYADSKGIAYGEVLKDFSYRDVLRRSLDNARRITVKWDNDDTTKETVYIPKERLSPQTQEAIEEAEKVISAIDTDNPPSPLDAIRSEIEMAGYSVREITGRETRVNYMEDTGDGPILERVPDEELDKNINKNQFNKGEVDALIINQSGSTGISLHSSKTYSDTRPRHMIVAQPPKDINTFVQMLGRVHRTNQAHVPRYTILNTDLPAEKRVMASLNKKMRSLNANTTSNDESATSLDTPDLLNKYGDEIVARYLQENPSIQQMVGKSVDPGFDTSQHSKIEGYAASVTGRIALMDVQTQENFYDTVEEEYTDYINYLDSVGQNDLVQQTVDLEARLEDEQLLAEGQDKTNIFGQDANLGRYSVKAQVNPADWNEVQQTVQANIGEETTAEGYVEELIQGKDDKAQPYMEQVNKKVEDAKKAVEQADTDAKKQNANDQLDKANDQLARAQQARAITNDLAQRFRPGTAHELQLGGEKVKGVVVSLSDKAKKKKSQNPFSLSKTQAQFMLTGVKRQMSIPFSQLYGDNSVVERGVPEHVARNSFQQSQGVTRERRYLATGNLIAALDRLSKGQVVSFSKEDGSTETGILLPRSFDPNKDAEWDITIQNPEVVIDFLTAKGHVPDVARFGVATRDSALRILPNGPDSFLIKTQKTKGAKFTKDQKLTEITGEFSGKTPQVEVDTKTLREALGRIMEMAPLSVTESLGGEIQPYIQRHQSDGAKFSVANKDGEKYFTEDAINSALNQNFKSREKLTYISPDDFLNLAETTSGDSGKEQTVSSVIDQGGKFESIPFLQISNEGGGNAIVTGHEGRHRARALKERGVSWMPVVLKASNIRWGEHSTGDSAIDDWPKRLYEQNDRLDSIGEQSSETERLKYLGRKRIEFPVPQDKAWNEASFSLGSGGGLPQKAVQDAVASYRKSENAPAIQAHATPQDLPDHVRNTAQSQDQLDSVEAAFDPSTNTVHVVASNIPSQKRMVEVVEHEMVGHYGFRGRYGKKADPILNQLYAKKRDKVKQIAQERGYDLRKPEERKEASEELLAQMAELDQEAGMLDKAVRVVREAIRAIRPQLQLSDGEIRAIIAKSKKYVANGKGQPSPDDGVHFSTVAAARRERINIQFENTRAREEGGPTKGKGESLFQIARPGGQAFKNWLAKQFKVSGNLGEETHEATLQQLNRLREEQKITENRVNELQSALKETYGGKKKVPQEDLQVMDQALAGSQEAMNILPDNVANALQAMRDHVDTLSTEMRRKGVIEGQGLQATIDENMGMYLHRSYAVFERPKAWKYEVSDSIVNRAKSFIRVEHEDMLARQYWEATTPHEVQKGDIRKKDGGLFKDKKSALSARSRRSDVSKDDTFPVPVEGGYVLRQPDLEEIKAEMDQEGTAANRYREEVLIGDRESGIIGRLLDPQDYSSPTEALAQAQAGASKDLSILKRRRNIPEAIRQLWGQHTDPIVNYTKSVNKQAQLISEHGVLSEIRRIGLEDGDYLSYGVPQGNHTAKIASKNSDTMWPLNVNQEGNRDDVYTSPEMADAINQIGSDNVEAPPWLQIWMTINSVARLSKTVLSPMTHTRNLVGNAGFAMANGHWRVGELGHSISSVANDLRGKTDAELEKEIARLVELGVIHEGVRSGELREAVEEAAFMSTEQFAQFDAHNKATRMGREKLSDLINLYQAEDDVWKVFAFRNEMARYAQAKPDWDQQTLEEKAARIVRRTYPTYSLVPRAIRNFRRFPLIGTFVSFPAEVWRIGWNLVDPKNGIIKQELDDPDLRPIAYQRMMGVAAAGTATTALSKATLMMLGLDDEDDENFRQFLPHWSKNSDIVYWNFTEDGEVTYIDASYTDPWAVIKEPVYAMLRGEDPTDSMVSAFQRAGAPFFGEEIFAEHAFDILRNSTKTGGRVYNPQDEFEDQSISIGKHLWEAFEPGAMDQAMDVYKGATNTVETYGKGYDPVTQIVAIASGQKAQTMNMSRALRFKAQNYDRKRREATQLLTNVTSRFNDVPEEDIRTAYRDMNATKKRLFSDMYKAIKAARQLGLSQREALSAMDSARISGKETRKLLRGRYVPYKPSSNFLEPDLKNALANGIPGKTRQEIVRDFRERARIVWEMFQDSDTEYLK